MIQRILSPNDRLKQDPLDDSIFYASPRFVYHLDIGFRKRLKSLYKEYVKPDSILLDLMSSWVSHLPEKVNYTKVIAHGMNEEELKANPRIDQYWVQDLNKHQAIQLSDNSIDYC